MPTILFSRTVNYSNKYTTHGSNIIKDTVAIRSDSHTDKQNHNKNNNYMLTRYQDSDEERGRVAGKNRNANAMVDTRSLAEE